MTHGDLIYFSFTVLTSTGFGDMYPTHPVARVLVTLEQIVGTLFVAIFIARARRRRIRRLVATGGA